jgi:hypothetical protein
MREEHINTLFLRVTTKMKTTSGILDDAGLTNAFRPVSLASSRRRFGIFGESLQLGANAGGDVGAVVTQMHHGHVLTSLINVIYLEGEVHSTFGFRQLGDIATVFAAYSDLTELHSSISSLTDRAGIFFARCKELNLFSNQALIRR